MTEQTTQEAPAIDKRAVNLRFALKKTIMDRVKDEVEADRAALTAAMVEEWKASGSKSATVNLPGEDGLPGDAVATFTLSIPKKPGLVVSSESDFLNWLEEFYPDLVTTEEVTPPPVIKRTASPDAITFLQEFAGVTVAGEVLMTADGEEVPGLSMPAAAPPKSFTVRYEKGGADNLLDAYINGDLSGLDIGNTLPAIGHGE